MNTRIKKVSKHDKKYDKQLANHFSLCGAGE